MSPLRFSTLFLAAAAAAPLACSAAPDDGAATESTAEAFSWPGSSGPRCVGKRGERGDHVVRLGTGDDARWAQLHVPLRYDSTRGATLVLNFHGIHSNAPEEAILTGMNLLSEERGFLVAYPQGTGTPLNKSWNAGTCCGEARQNGVDDVQYVKDLLAQIERDYCIDVKHVFATGFSNGGYMAHRLGCEMAGTFGAIAPVSGLVALSDAECQPARPMPVLDFHGTADPVVIFNGGTGIFGEPNTPVNDTIAFWRRKNGCADASHVVYSKGDTTCTAWQACAGGSEVEQCIIDGGGHTWPGGVPLVVVGKTTFDINANRAMLDFFDAHPLP